MEVGKHMHSYIPTYKHIALHFKITPWQTDTCTSGIVSTYRNHVGISTEGHACKWYPMHSGVVELHMAILYDM